MPDNIDVNRRVGELAVQIAGAARVFEQAGIDFCCAGKRTLGEACTAKGIDAALIIAALRHAPPGDEGSYEHWQSDAVADLIAHIVARHHLYVRSETPRIERWLDKVVGVHGQRHPELVRIQGCFKGISGDMAQHMAKEEMILFPAIARLARTEANRDGPDFGGIGHPIQMMMNGHEHSGRDLDQIRAETNDFTPPADACATYRVLFEALREYDGDMRRHVHLENNILFPRALAMEP